MPMCADMNFKDSGPLVDVTSQVEWGDVGHRRLPLLKCVCGARFNLGEEIVSVYRPWTCPKCKATLHFKISLNVYM